uniref:uncharacterized protein LOC105350834 n=1 Tax=Fragaria vesca subsp. vesca TaxID=101020 RepID=UPI0005C92DA6|nr:PREDICTED: uncharacterized protein LOC105350834 [Fragaria vesca subsp. vesca]
MREVGKRLEVARKGFQDSRKAWSVASTDLWMKEFMNSGSDLEHEAFLVFWLSRYIFHDGRDCVNKAVFSIAVRLARGVRIALAPAVLANIYRDLCLLKRTIVASNEFKVVIKSPFHLIQVWAWERFLELRPRPKGIGNAEPRMARWDKVFGLNVGELRSILDSAKEGFLWRPYAMTIENWKLPNYFSEKEKWVVISPGMNDDELLSFSICLRVNELFGFGTTQQYHPHRVALQFGYDQDIPAFGAPLKHNTYEILYIPSRHSEADASVRYLKWLKESMAGVKHRGMSPKKKAKEAVDEIDVVAIPCIHSTKNAVDFVQVSAARDVHGGNDSLVPPGFPQKRYRLQNGDPMEDDGLTISESLRIRKKHKTVETREGSDSQKLSADHDNILASSTADECSVNTMTSERHEKDIARGKALTWGGKKGKRKLRKVHSKFKSEMSKAAAPSDDKVSIFGDDGPSKTFPFEEQEQELELSSDSSSVEEPECAHNSSSCRKKVLELKYRVSRLEKIIELLKS